MHVALYCSLIAFKIIFSVSAGKMGSSQHVLMSKAKLAAIQRIVVLNQRRCRPWRHSVYVPHFILQNVCPLGTISKAVLLKRFCLSRPKILHLRAAVGPTLSRPARRSYPLSHKIKLLTALPFMEVVWDGCRLSSTSVWRCVQAVTNILLRHTTDHIRLPSSRPLHSLFVFGFFPAIASVVFEVGRFACWCAFIENIS